MCLSCTQVVSGALDRLHYEKDPCVKFDSTKKNWVYLHGDRTADELGMSMSFYVYALIWLYPYMAMPLYGYALLCLCTYM